MKNINKNLVLAIPTIAYFAFFYLLYLFAFGRPILGLVMDYSYIWLFWPIGVLMIFSLYIYLIVSKNITKADYYEVIPPLLVSLSTLVFLVFSPVDLLAQIIVFISTIVFFLSLMNITKITNHTFVSLISFFSAFLFFFSLYSIFNSTYIPYWVIIVFMGFFSSVLVFYKLKHEHLSTPEIMIFSLLVFIIISEVSFFLFFLPIGIFIKSLVLVFTYYLYWGALSNHIGGQKNFRDILRYILIFIAMVFVVNIIYILRS